MFKGFNRILFLISKKISLDLKRKDLLYSNNFFKMNYYYTKLISLIRFCTAFRRNKILKVRNPTAHIQICNLYYLITQQNHTLPPFKFSINRFLK